MSNNPLDNLAQQLLDEAEEQVAAAATAKEAPKEQKRDLKLRIKSKIEI